MFTLSHTFEHYAQSKHMGKKLIKGVLQHDSIYCTSIKLDDSEETHKKKNDQKRSSKGQDILNYSPSIA